MKNYSFKYYHIVINYSNKLSSKQYILKINFCYSLLNYFFKILDDNY